jgi:hypothetical protein
MLHKRMNSGHPERTRSSGALERRSGNATIWATERRRQVKHDHVWLMISENDHVLKPRRECGSAHDAGATAIGRQRGGKVISSADTTIDSYVLLPASHLSQLQPDISWRQPASWLVV